VEFKPSKEAKFFIKIGIWLKKYSRRIIFGWADGYRLSGGNTASFKDFSQEHG